MSRLHSRASVRHKARERWIRVDLRPTRLTTRIGSLDCRMISARLDPKRTGCATVVRSLSQRSTVPGRTLASHAGRPPTKPELLRSASNRVLKNYDGRRNKLFWSRARRGCRCNAQRALPGSHNAAPDQKSCCPSGCARMRSRGVVLGGDSLCEDCAPGRPQGAHRVRPCGLGFASPSSRWRAASPSQPALRRAYSDRNDGSS